MPDYYCAFTPSGEVIAAMPDKVSAIHQLVATLGYNDPVDDWTFLKERGYTIRRVEIVPVEDDANAE